MLLYSIELIYDSKSRAFPIADIIEKAKESKSALGFSND